MGKTKETKKLNYKKCRTCFNSSKGLKFLTKIALEATRTAEDPKTYAEMLEEVARINTSQDTDNARIPQQICSICIRKLAAAYDFVKQAQEVNVQLWSTFNSVDNCLQEHQIEYPLDSEQNRTEIKTESNRDNEEFFSGAQLDTNSDGDVGGKHLQPSQNEDLTLCEVNLKIESDHEQPSAEKITRNNKINEAGPSEFMNDSQRDNIDTDSLDSDEFLANDVGSSPLPSNTEDNDKEANKKQKNKNKLKRKPAKSNTNDDSDLPVPCDVCNKIFQNSKELMRHKRISHQKCTCPVCGNSFARPGNMYSHMRKLHGEESVKSIITARKQGEKTHECEECKKKFTRKSHLQHHIERKHNKEHQETPKKEKDKQPQKELCPICGSSFTSNSHLIIHIRRHTGERPFKCDLCERAYPRIADLNTHRRIHTGEKPYVCKLCGKAFRLQHKLKNHLRSHTDERPYKCTECDKAFKYSKDLNIHYRIHTGERPYTCDNCGSTFTQSNSLKAHRTKCGRVTNQNAAKCKTSNNIGNLSNFSSSPKENIQI